MAQVLLDASGLTAERPGRVLFRDVSITVHAGDRIGVVGINGTGKSTLLAALSGEREPEEGVVRRGRGATVAVLGQEPHLAGDTVREAVGDHWETAAVLDRLGVGDLLDAPLALLSGGQRKRAALAGCLVSGADLLLLDEPTNHLDLDAIAWLEDRLAEHTGALVLVTHDRHFLDRVTNRILELDRGRAHVHEGGYDAYLEGRARREEHAVKAEESRRNLARTELAWLRRGAPARTSKPKARIEAATAIVEGRAEASARPGDLSLRMDTPRLGDRVIELHGVGHRWADDARWLFSGVDLLLDPRERLGIVGPNGTGKSTLLEIMSGRLAPAAGRMEWGSTARVGYFDQRGRDLDPTVRVRDAFTGGHREADWRDAALLEAFWFDADAQWAEIGLLSGGERRRLQLVLTLAERPNVLLLDEPTNDLDLDTLRALEDFLEEWPGALVVVSHDRAFLERTVADVLVVDGAGSAGRRPGGYAAWEEERSLIRGRRRSLRQPAAGPKGAGVSSKVATARAGRAGGGGGRSASTIRHGLREAEKALARARRGHDALEAEVAELAAAGDHVRLAEVGARLAEAAAEVDAAEERWLELATEAEEQGLNV